MISYQYVYKQIIKQERNKGLIISQGPKLFDLPNVVVDDHSVINPKVFVE